MGSARYSCNARFQYLRSKNVKVEFLSLLLFMSKNLSTNICHRLQRLIVSYKGEISLHFDLPSLYSCRAQSPLLWALIRIPIQIQLESSNYCTFAQLLSCLGIQEQSAPVVNNKIRPLLDLYSHFEWLRPGPFN